MAKRSPAKQAELKANYARLRDAGYSAKDASRLRSASPTTINQALHTTPQAFREKRPVSEKHARAGGGAGSRYKKLDTHQPAALEYVPHKGRIKNSDYINMSEADRNYDNNLAYLMSYIAVDKYGVETRKYFTILPDEKMTLRQLRAFVYKNCDDQGKISTYQAKVKKSSIDLIAAYEDKSY
jgi:hypothetical protein